MLKKRNLIILGIIALVLMILSALQITILNPITTDNVMVIPLYCCFVLALYFIKAFYLWKEGNPEWDKQFRLSFIGIVLFFILTDLDKFLARDKTYYVYMPIIHHDFKTWLHENTLRLLIWPCLPLLPLGIVLLILGFMGLKYRVIRQQSYITVMFFIAVPIILISCYFIIAIFVGLLHMHC